MATQLRIRSLIVATATATQTFNFSTPCTLITGTVSMGKSTMLMLIKHALGGRAALTPAVREHVSYVQLSVQLGDTTLNLRRRVIEDDSTVEVVEPGSGLVEQILPVTPKRTDDLTISKVLLGQLEIPIERVPKSMRGTNADTVALTFNDIYGYCYLQAKEIDRSVIGHLDYRNQKRLAAFNLLFRLTDSHLLELQRQRNAAREEAKSTDTDVLAVERFIKESDIDETDKLRLRRLAVLAAVRRAEQRLQDVRDEVEALTTEDRESRRSLASSVANANQLRLSLNQARDVVAWREAALGQLRLDLGKAERLTAAAALLAPFEFLACPRCTQAITQRPMSEGHCVLCTQPEPMVDITDSSSSSVEIERLRYQIQETEGLLASDRERLIQSETALANAERRVGRLHREYDAATSESVSPRLEMIAARSAEAEGLRQDLREIDRAMRQWQRLTALSDRALDFKKREKALNLEIKAYRDRLGQDGDARLSELSSEFTAEVLRLGIPVQGEAHIDPNTYLPMVGDSSFETLQASGGGASTALNIAYHLTLLLNAVGDPNVLLPSLLIIDSPRKAIGNSEADRALGRAIYSRIRTITDLLGNKLQIIVADNDPPNDIVSRIPRIELSSDHSVVPGVRNTGVGRGSRVEDLESD